MDDLNDELISSADEEETVVQNPGPSNEAPKRPIKNCELIESQLNSSVFIIDGTPHVSNREKKTRSGAKKLYLRCYNKSKFDFT